MQIALAIILASCTPALHAQRSDGELEVAVAAVKAVKKEYALSVNTLMLPRKPQLVAVVASAVGAKPSTVETGLICNDDVRGRHCVLRVIGTNLLVQNIVIADNKGVVGIVVQRQTAGREMTTEIWLVHLTRVGKEWLVTNIRPGPVA